MAIHLFERMNRLVKADAHGLLDSLEDRALLLKQCLREAEIELQRKRARGAALDDEERSLRDEVKRLEESVSSLDADMHLALAKEREELARFAIRKIIPRRREITTLGSRIDEIAEERARLAPLLEQQEREFEDLRARVGAHLAQRTHAAEQDDMRLGSAVADEEVELELLRCKQATGTAH